MSSRAWVHISVKTNIGSDILNIEKLIQYWKTQLIYSPKYIEINFYFCFGVQQPHIITQSHLIRKAQSLESLSSFRPDPSQSKLALARMSNLKHFNEHYELLNKYTSDVKMRKQLFLSIAQIKQRAPTRNSQFTQSQQAFRTVENRVKNAKMKRISIEKTKRLKNIKFLENNEYLREKREKKVIWSNYDSNCTKLY